MWRVVLLFTIACHHDLDAVSRPQSQTDMDAAGDTTTGELQCPTNYKMITHAGGVGYYLVVRDPMLTFGVANATCMAQSVGSPTHLAVFAGTAGIAEMGAVADHAYNNATGGGMLGGNAWIGLADAQMTNIWTWVTDELPLPPGTGTPWDTAEPMNAPSEDCAHLGGSPKLLRDSYCTSANSYICECDHYATNSSHVP